MPDDRAGEVAAPRRGEGREPGEHVRDDDLRQRDGHRTRDQRTRRTAPERLGHELVAVEALAAQRHEQGRRLERAAVGGHDAECSVRAVQDAAADPRELGEAADHASAPSASSTT